MPVLSRSGGLGQSRLSLSWRAGSHQRPARERRECRQQSIEVAPLLGSQQGRHDIPQDLPFPFEEAVDFVFLVADGDELGHRLAALGNDDTLGLGLNFVHHREAMNFELPGRHGLHEGFIKIMVITHGREMISCASRGAPSLSVRSLQRLGGDAAGMLTFPRPAQSQSPHPVAQNATKVGRPQRFRYRSLMKSAIPA